MGQFDPQRNEWKMWKIFFLFKIWLNPEHSHARTDEGVRP